MGWVDHDAIWRLDVASARVDTIPLASGARYISLHAGDGGRFAVAHPFAGPRFEVTVRACDDPATALARSTIGADGKTVDGDATQWAGVRRLYVEYLTVPPWNDFVLVTLTPAMEIQELSWYDDSYD